MKIHKWTNIFFLYTFKESCQHNPDSPVRPAHVLVPAWGCCKRASRHSCTTPRCLNSSVSVHSRPCAIIRMGMKGVLHQPFQGGGVPKLVRIAPSTLESFSQEPWRFVWDQTPSLPPTCCFYLLDCADCPSPRLAKLGCVLAEREGGFVARVHKELMGLSELKRKR